MKSKRYSTGKSIYASRQRRAKGDVSVKVANEAEPGDAATDTAASEGAQTTRNTTSQHYDKPEYRLTRVMSGCLDNLPPLQPKVVRIFTSSTFTGESAI